MEQCICIIMALPLYSLLLWHGNGHSQISEHLNDRPILGKGGEPQKVCMSVKAFSSHYCHVIQLHWDIIFEPMSF